ncbi:MAG: PEGA domain-containing protein [Polyangiaceae bacterium]
MRIAPLLLALSVGLAAAPSLAQPRPAPASASGSAIETARARYKEGALAFQQKRYKDAIDLFLEADRLASSPAFAFNVAIAYEAMGDTASTLRWLRTYLRRAPDAADRPAVEERIRSHEQKLAARGVQQVTLLSTPEGATVELDGRAVGVTPWTGEIAPGSHEAVLQLRGWLDARQRFELAADRASDVSIALSAAPAESAPTATGAADTGAPAPAGTEVGRIGPLTWIALGAGVVGLGGALGFELARSGAEDSAREAPTQVETAEHLDDMEGRRTVARVLLGVGGAALLTGGVLLVVDLASGSGSGSEPSARAAPRFAAGCDLAGCGALLRGGF